MACMFDSHAHLTDSAYAEDRGAIINEMISQGIYALCTAYDEASCIESLKLAGSYSNIWAACGLHPSEAKLYSAGFESLLKECLSDPVCIALGEIGLDYYWDKTQKAQQRSAFEKQLAIAGEYGKASVVHCREAAQDTYDLLMANAAPGQIVVLHAFSQSPEMLKRYISAPFSAYFSVAGPVTFKNASSLRQAVAAIPLHRLLVETDCPYLTPVPFRGKRNSPLYLGHTLSQVASVMGISLEQAAEETSKNAETAFGISMKMT
ncbi:MAG: TatD family hydrolase [Eubacteriaceae bacterium]|nr:TatD family hydrolase [Eubacteriaceae bacterium]